MLEMGGTTDKYVGRIGLRWKTIRLMVEQTFSLTEKGHQFIGHIEEQMSMPYSNLLIQS